MWRGVPMPLWVPDPTVAEWNSSNSLALQERAGNPLGEFGAFPKALDFETWPPRDATDSKPEYTVRFSAERPMVHRR